MDSTAELLAITGATIIDGTGSAPIDNAVILIDRARIVAIGDGSIQVPPQASRIEAKGKFIIPGLMATNVYLADGTWVPMLISCEGRYDEVAIEAAQLALRGGVTSVFDTWGPRDALVKARNAVHQGQRIAARIFLCGNWVGMGGPFSDDLRPQFREAAGEPFARRVNSLWEANVGEELTRMSPNEVRQEVRAYVQSGIDFLTYPVNAHRKGASSCILFSPRVQRVIVEEAQRAGLPVRAMFATTEEGIDLALQAGADIVEPIPYGGKPMSTAMTSLIARRGIPFLFESPSADELEWYRQKVSSCGPSALKAMETAYVDEQGLIGAGATLLLGRWGGLYSADQIEVWGQSGAPTWFVPLGEGHIFGLHSLQQKGMKPMEALMAATRNVARAFKVDKELGTLETGKLADLVILDKNPLENTENYRSISIVMKGGTVVDRKALPTERLIAVESIHSERVS